MKDYYLSAENACRIKYRRIYLRLREFEKNNNDIKHSSYYGHVYFSPANRQLLRWYGNGYHFLNRTLLLDMI